MSAFENFGNMVLRLWEHGQAFLWGCAASCALVFALLCGGWYFGFGTVTTVLAQYGLFVLIAGVVFVALAIARTVEARPKRELFFIPNEEQSIWGHARQGTGEVYTNFNFRMAATNTSDGAVHLSKPRVVWPLRACCCEQVTAVLMTQNTTTFHASQEFAIAAHERTQVSGVIALKGNILRPGKRLTFVVSVSDHQGRRRRIKFRHVRASNDRPV